MAKILCKISGLEFRCEHVPIYLNEKECAHPIFYISQDRLISLIPKYFEAKLTEVDSYLLFLALLNSTGMVQFRVAANYTGTESTALVANNMESLVRILNKISSLKNPDKILSHVAITQDSCTLSSLPTWIEVWETNIKDYDSRYKEANRRERLKIKELALESMIKNVNKTPESYANSLAEWAAQAGEFPNTQVLVYQNGKNNHIALSDYWKSLIKKCTKPEAVFSIDSDHLESLILHCEDNIPHGSIFANSLMKILREAQTRNSDLLGINAMSNIRANYLILGEDNEGSFKGNSTEESNLINMINSAPKDEPKLEDYPNKIAYLRAKAKYAMALEAKLGNSLNSDKKEPNL